MRKSILMLSVVLTAAGLWGCSADSPSPSANSEANVELPAADSHPDYENIQGTWKIVSSEWDGAPNDRVVGNYFTFKGSKLKAWLRDIGEITLQYEMDPNKQPKHLTAKWGLPPDEKIYTAIYELDGDTMKFCFRERDRPTGFQTEQGSWWTSHVLQRTEGME